MGWAARYTSPDNPARATVPPARTAGSTMETEFTVVRVEAMAESVSGIASSYSENPMLRAADVTLKERRRLVLLVRESPCTWGTFGY